MLTGFSAFPLTPIRDNQVDLEVFAKLISRLVVAGVDSIGALGSTGSYAYLDRDERRSVATSAVDHAAGIPVIIGIGALRTSLVQTLAEDAQQAGASAVLLAPVSYQPLTPDEVFSLYEDVTAGLSVPLVIYDNPGTTHFSFTDDLYASITRLPHVAAIKIPPVGEVAASKSRVEEIRRVIPSGVTIGISGDAVGAAGLLGGCDCWYSAAGGIIPQAMLAIARPALANAPSALAQSSRLQPLWELFAAHGSARVIAAIAEYLELVVSPSLPRPLLGVNRDVRKHLVQVVNTLHLTS